MKTTPPNLHWNIEKFSAHSVFETRHPIIEILRVRPTPPAHETGTPAGKFLQTLKNRSAVGANLLGLDLWAKDMILEAVARSCYVSYAPSFGRSPFGSPCVRQPTTLWRMECPSAIHSLTETFGTILSDSGFLINTEFGVLDIGPTSGPT
ncbi:hypothetical protein O4214_28535 [Rhodococcus erythropolis]|uniref:hypothetical protein n=1 Tax=Rhodococcus erythropolis TaxID=1833 RepID=UPI001E377E1E|nr:MULTISPECIES: hypothetical protein [Rhodococcus erythropolis group]MCD2109013.1 hypothetical protein [Rhodococcus qingshengii]MCZ4527939.1 hypothetical protein [Rhodococcus erythropolis]